MKLPKKAIFPLILVVICLCIKIYSSNAARVELGYSLGTYPAIGRGLRALLGQWSFSVGDILYGAAFLFVCYKLVRMVRFIYINRTRELYVKRLKLFLYRGLITACVLYILFNVLWGINYNRQGIAAQLQLKIEKYSKEDLRQLNCLLIDKVNASKRSWVAKGKSYPSTALLFQNAGMAYKKLQQEYSFLQMEDLSVKPSIWSWLGNYSGFTGYYNPFTGEAQVNTTIPRFLQPYTTCHELAHQLGYAREMEANFVGYLAARASSDTLFHYSVYLDLFMYANRNLYMNDSVAAKHYRKDLAPAVVDDLREWQRFRATHSGRLEPFIRWIYGKFLQSNQQPNGISSYDEVTGYLMAYYKKYGKI